MRTQLSVWVAAAVAAGLPMVTFAQDAATAAPAAATMTAPAEPAVAAPSLPFGANEVLKMHRGGISKDVILGYVKTSLSAYHLNADQIIYLQQVGLPQDEIKAMIYQDHALQQNAASQAVAAAQQQAQQPMPTPQVIGQQPMVVPSTPAPAVTYAAAQQAYPDYGVDYGYSYPDYGGTVVIGAGWPYWGFGWGWPGYYGGYYHGGYYRGGFHGGYYGHGGGGFHGGGGGGFHGGGGGGHR